APGPLRKLIEDPRTVRGPRHRTFPIDKPAPLFLTDPLPRAEFALCAADGSPAFFARESVALGFEITVRDAPEGKVQVRLVPRARYREPSRLLPPGLGERDPATQTLPAARFRGPPLPSG